MVHLCRSVRPPETKQGKCDPMSGPTVRSKSTCAQQTSVFLVVAAAAISYQIMVGCWKLKDLTVKHAKANSVTAPLRMIPVRFMCRPTYCLSFLSGEIRWVGVIPALTFGYPDQRSL